MLPNVKLCCHKKPMELYGINTKFCSKILQVFKELHKLKIDPYKKFVYSQNLLYRNLYVHTNSAIHSELVSSLPAGSFSAALKDSQVTGITTSITREQRKDTKFVLAKQPQFHRCKSGTNGITHTSSKGLRKYYQRLGEDQQSYSLQFNIYLVSTAAPHR